MAEAADGGCVGSISMLASTHNVGRAIRGGANVSRAIRGGASCSGSVLGIESVVVDGGGGVVASGGVVSLAESIKILLQIVGVAGVAEVDFWFHGFKLIQ